MIVNLDTDFAEERFKAGEVVLVGPDATPRTIRTARFHQGRPVLALDGIETMDDAEALAGAELKLPATELGPLPAQTYYRHDLVGCEVKTAGGQVVGKVTGVEGPLERSLLVVAAKGGEVMIPMVDAFIVRVDAANREIIVAPPEGLIDLATRTS